MRHMHNCCITLASFPLHGCIIPMRGAHWGQGSTLLGSGLPRTKRKRKNDHLLALNPSIDNTHLQVHRNALICKGILWFASWAIVVSGHYKTAANPHECWPSNTTGTLQEAFYGG